MDAVVMCGGEGSRLRDGGIATEKPLVEVGGRPMLDRVWDTLADSRVDAVYAAVSPAAPRTRERAREVASGADAVIETPGDGYVPDLDRVLASVSTPVLTVAVDLPLLAPTVVNRVLGVAGGDSTGVPSMTVCVPAALKRRLGASVDTTLSPGPVEDGQVLPESASEPIPELAPTGLNVVADAGNTTWISYDARLAVNVNRPADLELAEVLCP
jgi:adenosylcobinamide-phosphate guanylyltransferase